MNKINIIVSSACALLMSPAILLGALFLIVKQYFVCGMELGQLAGEELGKWLGKHDK